MSQHDISLSKLAFSVIDLKYDGISDGFYQRLKPTLKKVRATIGRVLLFAQDFLLRKL